MITSLFPAPTQKKDVHYRLTYHCHYQVGFELRHRQKSGRLPATKQREPASVFRTEPLPHHTADCPVMCSGWALTTQHLLDVTLLLTCPRHWPSSPDALGGALLCPQNLLYTGDFSGSPSVKTREVLPSNRFRVREISTC